MKDVFVYCPVNFTDITKSVMFSKYMSSVHSIFLFQHKGFVAILCGMCWQHTHNGFSIDKKCAIFLKKKRETLWSKARFSIASSYSIIYYYCFFFCCCCPHRKYVCMSIVQLWDICSGKHIFNHFYVHLIHEKIVE